MNKIWFIKFEGIEEGPYSIQDLKYDRRITPDTLVWREGFTQWVPIRNVPELQEVFEEEPQPKPLEEGKLKKKKIKAEKEALAVHAPYEFNPFLFWLLIMLIVLGYFLHLMQRLR